MTSKMDYMKRHAESIGRDPAEVGVAMKAPLYDTQTATGEGRRRFSGGAEQVVEDVHTYAALGVSHLIFDVRSNDLNHILERITWLAEDVMTKS